MSKLTKSCPTCGKTFETYPSVNKKFCSRACKGADQKLHPNKPRTGDYRNCEQCGKEFYRQPSEAKRNARYCSHACKIDSQRTGKLKRDCAHCGKEFEFYPSASYRVYCSTDCSAHAKTITGIGRLHNGKQARRNDDGYILVWEPQHSNARQGWIFEHRLAAEQILGRPLVTDEHVHHLNGVKDDNRVENLQIIGNAEHGAITGRTIWDAVTEMRTRLQEYERRFGPL